ncbi:10672_t:CDS:2 [Paraglomus brasilianum]|uniref:10672_t:CDS:1 n=1 Tax=Paraglomus brasilianum TaxID=144538 RepID=A0A9N9CJK8_9GLOM|nr:10672_t:CDS:2 [Paraglomus brasilianum]
MSTSSLTISETSDPRDVEFMRLAIEQAKLSAPVPTAYCVGAVLINPQTFETLATGYSRELPGNTHAEECCLIKLSSIDPSSISSFSSLTIYTTMEPCSTRLSGKKSCTELIMASPIKRVVMGVAEPDRFVKCEGVRMLMNEGIEVTIVPGVAEECLSINRHVL